MSNQIRDRIKRVYMAGAIYFVTAVTKNRQPIFINPANIALLRQTIRRDERDYLNHLHYIHYNPVKHGLVIRPEDYPHSSYHEYLKRGWYEIGWGHIEPGSVKNLDF